MALGNWATLAVRFDGTVVDTVEVGWPTSPAGARVEVYKNWIYVHDARLAKGEHDYYSSDVVMEVQKGDLTYADWHVRAVRGPQDGVYVVAWFRDVGDPENPRYAGFVGCGVYGYDGNDWVGVRPSSAAHLRKVLARLKDDLPAEMLAVQIPDVSVDQGGAFFARNVPKVLADPKFDPEKAR